MVVAYDVREAIKAVVGRENTQTLGTTTDSCVWEIQTTIRQKAVKRAAKPRGYS